MITYGLNKEIEKTETIRKLETQLQSQKQLQSLCKSISKYYSSISRVPRTVFWQLLKEIIKSTALIFLVKTQDFIFPTCLAFLLFADIWSLLSILTFVHDNARYFSQISLKSRKYHKWNLRPTSNIYETRPMLQLRKTNVKSKVSVPYTMYVYALQNSHEPN